MTRASRLPFCTLPVAAYLAVLVGLSLYFRALWPTLQGFVDGIDHCRLLFCDFLAHYLPMGETVWETERPRLGFYYSPSFAIALSGLAALGERPAVWLWSLLQVATPALLFALTARRLCGGSVAWSTGYLLVFATSLPVLHNFKWGQVSLLAVLAVLAALELAERGRPRSAGLVLALAITVKYYPALALLVFWARGQRRVVAHTLLWSALSLVVVPTVAFGAADTWEFYATLRQFADFNAAALARDPNSQFAPHAVGRLLGTPPAPWWTWASYAIAVAQLALAVATARSARRDAGDTALCTALTALPFMLPTSWPHYFVYLPVCQLLLLRRARATAGAARLVIAAAALVAVGLASVCWFEAVGGRAHYGARGDLFLANCAVAAGLWVAWLTAPRAAA